MLRLLQADLGGHLILTQRTAPDHREPRSAEERQSYPVKQCPSELVIFGHIRKSYQREATRGKL